MDRPPLTLPTRLRCAIILTAHDQIEPVEWASAIKATCAQLGRCFPAAEVTGLVATNLDDIVDVSLAHRPLGRGFDGGLEVTFSNDTDPASLLAIAPVVTEALGVLVDGSGSVANIGTAHYAVLGLGVYAFTQVGFRAAGTSDQDFVRWWTSHHSQFNVQNTQDALMKGYSMQHRMDPVTHLLNEELGYAGAGDIYDPVYFDDVDLWRATVSPEMAAAALQDEAGHFAHYTMRVKIQRVVASFLVAG
jgi:hypothetical protein